MTWKSLKDRLSKTGGTPGAFVSPSFVLEVEPGFVLAARVDRSARRVRRMAARELQDPSFAPQLNQANISNLVGLDRAIREVAEAVVNGNGRLGLLVPDPVVRVCLLSFETLPEAKREVDALVRWRMRELLPFPPEEARLSYQVLRREPEGIEVLAIAAKNSVLAEYEAAVDRLNGGPALILPATAALLPLLQETDEAGQLLIHACSGWVTTVVVAGKFPRAWRTQDLSRTPSEERAGEVAREVGRVVASSRDRLKVQIERIYLCSRPAARQEELIAEIARTVSGEVKLLEPDPDKVGTLLSGGEGALFRRYGATVAGVVSNSGH